MTQTLERPRTIGHTFAAHSHPPLDADETPLELMAPEANAAAGKAADPDLVVRLQALVESGNKGHVWSRGELARAIGTNAANISIYLRQLQPSPPPMAFALGTLESKVRDFLRQIAGKRDFNLGIVDTAVVRRFGNFVDRVREANEVGFYYGPAGLGKSTAIEHYAEQNANAITITATKWQANIHGITTLLYKALKSPSLPRGTQRGTWLAETLKDRETVIIIDNAHRLTVNATEFLFDLYDVTGTPLVFVGNPRFLHRLKPDDQLHSRIFLKLEASFPVSDTGDRNKELHAAADALLKRELPDHAAELRTMARRVAREAGHLRALVKRCRLTAQFAQLPVYRDRPIADVFAAAHAASIHDGYALTDD